MSRPCNNSACEETATRVMAMSPVVTPCVFVAPYCETHAEEVARNGGWFASGPALAEELQGISGVRR